MIYFTSDTHFNHKNILQYCKRPFNSIEEMNQAMIDNWNNTIQDDDDIYHLGDIMLGNETTLKQLIPKLKGRKYLIKGNHDKKSTAFYTKCGFIVLPNGYQLDDYKLILSHRPMSNESIPKGYINLHGHIHNTPLSPEFDKDNHHNVSVEVNDYTPIEVHKILEKRK